MSGTVWLKGNGNLQSNMCNYRIEQATFVTNTLIHAYHFCYNLSNTA